MNKRFLLKFWMRCFGCVELTESINFVFKTIILKLISFHQVSFSTTEVFTIQGLFYAERLLTSNTKKRGLMQVLRFQLTLPLLYRSYFYSI